MISANPSMNRLILCGLVASLASAGCFGRVSVPGTEQPAPAPPPERRIIAYLAAWTTGERLRIPSIPAERLTHINYAFAGVSADGRAVLGDPCRDAGDCSSGQTSPEGSSGNFGALLELKRQHPHLRILVSLGGWTGSGRFSDVALTDSSRRIFARSALELFLDRWPGLFDGFDIDWEFPVSGGLPENITRPEDKRNNTLLLREFRRQLDERARSAGRPFLLTIAASARPREIANLELLELVEILDWINVMTYDYHAGHTIANFDAPLYAAPGDPTPELTTHATVRLFLEGGVPADRIVIGVPFHGRALRDVAPENNGLYQSAEPDTSEWSRGLNYRSLTARQPESRGFRRHWSSQARVPWLYNQQLRIWITYDDAESVAAKAGYVREQRLGGIMFWELSGDDGTLLRAIEQGLERPAVR